MTRNFSATRADVDRADRVDLAGKEDAREAVRLAEQAALGSVLLDPTLVPQLSGWLRAEDFTDAWHREVYLAIREVAAAHTILDARSVAQQLVDRHGFRVADPARLLDLIAAVPVQPRPLHYATAILESSLRRQVACHGVLLEAAALAAALERNPAIVDRVTAQIDAAVDAAQTRWAVATRATVLELSSVDLPIGTPAAASIQPTLPSLVAADRILSRNPLPETATIHEREAALVASLVAHPEHIPSVSAWLTPDALAGDAWRPAYSALIEMYEARAPIDLVTLSWHVARNSAANGPGPGVGELRALVEHASIIDPTRAAAVVAGDQLRLTASRSADALRLDALSLGLDLRDLLDTTTLHTSALRASASHLRQPPRADSGDVVDRSPAIDLDRSRARANGRPHLVLVSR